MCFKKTGCHKEKKSLNQKHLRRPDGALQPPHLETDLLSFRLFLHLYQVLSSWGGHYSAHTIYTAPLRPGAIYRRTRSTTSPTSHMFCGRQELWIGWHCWVCLPQSRWGKTWMFNALVMSEKIYSAAQNSHDPAVVKNMDVFGQKKHFFSVLKLWYVTSTNVQPSSISWQLCSV